MKAQIPEAFEFLFHPARYKVSWGGRGAAKSWQFARALLGLGADPRMLFPDRSKLRVLCARETQKSIADSVHRLLSDQAVELGLGRFYNIQKASIIGANGTEFLFAGLRHNIHNIKSVEAVDIVWVEEGQSVSKTSWDILIPTIRKEGSEIWVSFNPELESDDTYKRFVLHPPPGAKVVKVGFRDNPFFPEVLKAEAAHLKATDPDAYNHVWEGCCRQMLDGAVYATELRALDSEGRIMRVPYDPTSPVHTFWDLGFGDNTSIWFAQSIGFEFRLIDFESDCQKGLQHYLKLLQTKPYVYGTHHLPHDASHHELGTGRTIAEQVRAMGHTVNVLPRLSVVDGIAAARAIFPKCYFDADKCADGLQALRHYRYERDEHTGTFKRDPLHDWASHPADAFRYFAMAIREPERKRAIEMEDYGGGSWMG